MLLVPRHPLVSGSKGVNRQESWLCTQHFSLGIADRDKLLLALIAWFLFFSPVAILLSRVLENVLQIYFLQQFNLLRDPLEGFESFLEIF